MRREDESIVNSLSDYSDDNDVLSVANIYKECQHYIKTRKQSVVSVCVSIVSTHKVFKKKNRKTLDTVILPM